MKIWFEHCNQKYYLDDDSDVKFGIGWYRHSPLHKWRGISIHLYLYFVMISIHMVDNYDEYRKRMNYKRDPDHLKKLGERLRAKKEKK
jgi:hypothetical protein